MTCRDDHRLRLSSCGTISSADAPIKSSEDVLGLQGMQEGWYPESALPTIRERSPIATAAPQTRLRGNPESHAESSFSRIFSTEVDSSFRPPAQDDITPEISTLQPDPFASIQNHQKDKFHHH